MAQTEESRVEQAFRPATDRASWRASAPAVPQRL